MSLAGRFLDALVRRCNSAQQRIDELLLVKAPALKPGENDTGLIHSQFNPRWLEELRIEPKLVLDIGSCDGAMAQYFREWYPQAKIYSFEADPIRIEVVKKNAPQGVKVVHAAVCGHNGTATFYSGGAAFRAQGSMLKGRFPLKQTTVSATRLDNIFGDEIDFIHMDIEGAEHMAIKGLGGLRPKVIFLETHDRTLWHGSQSCHRLLSSMGYVLAGDFAQDRLYVHHKQLND